MVLTSNLDQKSRVVYPAQSLYFMKSLQQHIEQYLKNMLLNRIVHLIKHASFQFYRAYILILITYEHIYREHIEREYRESIYM